MLCVRPARLVTMTALCIAGIGSWGGKTGAALPGAGGASGPACRPDALRRLLPAHQGADGELIPPGSTVAISVDSGAPPSGVYALRHVRDAYILVRGLSECIPIAGITVSRAEQAVAKALAAGTDRPTVRICIVAQPWGTVRVRGAVRSPGLTGISEDATLADVLAYVGSADVAALNRVLITRRTRVQAGVRRSTFRVDPARYLRREPGRSSDESQNPRLLDGDEILVAPVGPVVRTAG